MTETQHRTPHVLVMGWDGVRDDVRRAARTPHLDRLAARGFESTVRVHEKNRTISGPVWSTIATGVHADQHGVVDNDFRSHRFAEHPDVLSRVRAARPGATTFAAAPWAPLVTTDSGGPLFPGGHHLELGGQDPLAALAACDEAVTGRVAQELLTADHAAVFSHHDLPDGVGHHEGVTDAYRAAVETCDAQLRVLLAAIEARPHRESEDWTVIVVTDHGHTETGGHGGDSEDERLAWIVAAGPGIDSDSGRGVDHADVMAHALTALGIEIDLGTIAGRPFGARAETGR